MQNRSSRPEVSLARTRAAAPQRSQRSALVSSALVRVAFMASPFLASLQPSQTFTVSALFPDRYQVCRFSRIFGAPFGQAGRYERPRRTGAFVRCAAVV